MIMESPGRTDDNISSLHRVGFVLAHEDRFLRRFANQAGFTTQVAVRLGALAGHEDLRVHPDRKMARLDADHRAHSCHSVGANGDDLTRTHQTSTNAVPTPMRGGITPSRYPPRPASQARADKRMFCKKPFQVFVCGADVNHSFPPFEADEEAPYV